MSQFARITNIDVLRDFRAALASFAEDAGLGLSEAQSDVQRTIWWISQDRQAHWRREHKKRTEKLNQAKAELFKKQLESNDTRTSAVVERKNVAKAEAALHEAESKLQAIKRWSSHLEREFMLFKAACGQVSGAVQADVPAAATTLGRAYSSGPNARFFNIIEAGSVYVERMRQLDLRLSKLFRVGTTRTSVNFDFYNVLNSNSVINENITYGATWRAPQTILLPRIFKLSAQFDF